VDDEPRRVPSGRWDVCVDRACARARGAPARNRHRVRRLGHSRWAVHAANSRATADRRLAHRLDRPPDRVTPAAADRRRPHARRLHRADPRPPPRLAAHRRHRHARTRPRVRTRRAGQPDRRGSRRPSDRCGHRDEHRHANFGGSFRRCDRRRVPRPRRLTRRRLHARLCDLCRRPDSRHRRGARDPRAQRANRPTPTTPPARPLSGPEHGNSHNHTVCAID
jgi:hypothetical protein